MNDERKKKKKNQNKTPTRGTWLLCRVQPLCLNLFCSIIPPFSPFLFIFFLPTSSSLLTRGKDEIANLTICSQAKQVLDKFQSRLHNKEGKKRMPI